MSQALDSFIEAQIHGPIDLQTDVRQLVADPAFNDGAVGDALRELSARFGWPLTWHPGFVLPLRDVPAVFRGYALTGLAERAARDGALDAAVVGEAANLAERDPDARRNGDSLDDMRARPDSGALARAGSPRDTRRSIGR